MKIKILKLANGDDIISDIEEDGEKIKLDNPAKMILISMEGGLEIVMVPWFIYSDKEKWEITKSYVLTMVTPPDEICNDYKERFGDGDGIITPPTDIIL